MKCSWTKGLTSDDKKLMEGYFLESPLLRERLASIIEDKILLRNKSLYALKAYESPSWAYEQADGRGYERALSEVLELISSNPVK
jgi:hypothetical protein